VTSFDQTLRLAGLMPREVEADGKLRRCATATHPHKRNGWYLLHLDGRNGVWGDNAVAPRQALGRWADASTTAYQPSAAEQERQSRAREKARRDRVQAIRSARAFWNAARPCTRLHPYLAAKGLSPLGTQGLREAEGFLVIPVRWNGAVISVQTIHPDGTKRFWAGAPVKAGSFVIDRPRAALTCVVEGAATGLAVYQCMRHARVIVAFDAGNLLPVVDLLRPTGSVVLVADNDHGTQQRRGTNPGLEKARNAAELIGAGVAWFEGINGTDAADALKEWGEHAPRRIERLIQAQARYVAGVA
jgi:putative DNA primase/helicase